MFQLGIDQLLTNSELKDQLKNKKLAFVGHPASVTKDLTHSLNALVEQKFNVVCAYGPQHGMRGEKQDNMIESEDYLDPELKIPVFSLYGSSRRPSEESLKLFDICLFDLQDVGTRIYTFLTTLRYMMEGCAKAKKALWILDRPNPAGRPIEGTLLREGWESFVGAGPFPMRHGMTLGECALWFKDFLKLDIDLKVIKMQDYNPDAAPYFGWPSELSWVNPSPNAATPHMAKTFPGTVMIEGTHLSEGRGTTHPLELLGASDIDIHRILKKMKTLAPEWTQGCIIRACYFEPTFHKHQKTLCQGFQIHVDHPTYNHYQFKPYRLVALFFKALRLEYPGYQIWKQFAYEYEHDRLAIDLINGSPLLREWVDDKNGTVADFEKANLIDERAWKESTAKYLLY
ncbi:MAG: hypothetical protein RJB66_1008 [Pseudomonadota bacterium]|jgi:uncharacterized protein YbbC (DUF1343 family)